MQTQTTTIKTQIPLKLFSEMEQLVQLGWFQTVDDLVVSALRRYLEAHQGELMEQFIQEDIEWGLCGTD